MGWKLSRRRNLERRQENGKNKHVKFEHSVGVIYEIILRSRWRFHCNRVFICNRGYHKAGRCLSRDRLWNDLKTALKVKTFSRRCTSSATEVICASAKYLARCIFKFPGFNSSTCHRHDQVTTTLTSLCFCRYMCGIRSAVSLPL